MNSNKFTLTIIIKNSIFLFVAATVALLLSILLSFGSIHPTLYKIQTPPQVLFYYAIAIYCSIITYVVSGYILSKVFRIEIVDDDSTSIRNTVMNAVLEEILFRGIPFVTGLLLTDSILGIDITLLLLTCGTILWVLLHHPVKWGLAVPMGVLFVLLWFNELILVAVIVHMSHNIFSVLFRKHFID